MFADETAAQYDARRSLAARMRDRFGKLVTARTQDEVSALTKAGARPAGKEWGTVRNRRDHRAVTRASGRGRLPGRPKAGTLLPWPPPPRPARVRTASEEAERTARRTRATRRQRLADLRAEIPLATRADLARFDAHRKRARRRQAEQQDGSVAA